MSKVVDPARIYMRDQQSYCGILLDNKNNRPVCQRLETMGGKVNKALSFLGLGAGGLALGDVAKDIALAAVRYDTLGIATTQA